MKLPNSYGSVYKLSGARRNPWAAMKTVGWDMHDGKAKQIRKAVGYYPTKKEALEALAQFNAVPAIKNDIKVKQVIDNWAKTLDNYAEGTQKAYARAISRCESIWHIPICQLRYQDMQNVIDKQSALGAKSTLKNLFSNLYAYCIKQEWIEPSRIEICRLLNCSEGKKKWTVPRDVFTPDEVQELWNRCTGATEAAALVLLYTGMRVSELLDMKAEDVDMKNKILLVKKSKTDAGVREIPMHCKIEPIIAMLLKQSRGYLITPSRNAHMMTTVFRKQWDAMMQDLGMEHRIHDTRHSFVTCLVEHGADERIVKNIVGHKATNVTDSVYTHISREKRMAEIMKLEYVSCVSY